MRVSRETHGDERLVLLAAALDTRVGLTFGELCEQGLLGSPDAKEQSRRRSLRRAFAQFDEMGIKVEEVETGSERRWRIDARMTYAQPAEVTLDPDEASDALAAVAAYLDGSHRPYEGDVRRAGEKIAAVAGVCAFAAAGKGDGEGAGDVWHTLLRGRVGMHPCAFAYRDAQGRSARHVLQVWGFFDHARSSYVVGHDETHADDRPVRTFRVDRIEQEGLRVLEDRSYEIPADFSVDDYRRLPFEFGSGDPVRATFACGPADRDRLEHLTCNKGDWEQAGDGWAWHVLANDLPGCAAWAVGAAAEGLVPIGPPELLRDVRAGLERTVATHG